MIGIYVEGGEHEKYGAKELFELLKIPVEIYNSNNNYDIVVANAIPPKKNYTSLVLTTCKKTYICEELKFDNKPITNLRYNSSSVPLYSGGVAIKGNACLLQTQYDGINLFRMGYDLFKETYHLLNIGQPPEYVSIPSLDIHIDILRDYLRTHTMLIEIPSVLWGYRYTVALTHDVDCTSLKEHLSTVLKNRVFLGRLYYGIRSLLMTGNKKMSGEMRHLSVLEFAHIIINSFTALASNAFPPIEDPWTCFERIIEIEDKYDANSSFYFATKQKRDIRYDIHSEMVKQHILYLLENGRDVGVHSIDGWRNEKEAENELIDIFRLTKKDVGVRSHWLSFDSESWKKFDKTNYFYDTTFGYNGVVGFRAGTCNVYRPFDCGRLFELPLHIQDGSLLRGKYLGLPPKRARKLAYQILGTTKQYEGVCTLLFHQVTFSTEYATWRKLYEQILIKAKNEGAWITSGLNVVRWYKNRREIRFQSINIDDDILRVKFKKLPKIDLSPRLRVYVHPKKVKDVDNEYMSNSDRGYIDIKCDKDESTIRLSEEYC